MENQTLEYLKEFKSEFIEFKEHVDQRFDGMENKINGMENKIEGVENKIDGLEKKIETEVGDLAAMIVRTMASKEDIKDMVRKNDFRKILA
jgi:hypothetical protein